MLCMFPSDLLSWNQGEAYISRCALIRELPEEIHIRDLLIFILIGQQYIITLYSLYNYYIAFLPMSLMMVVYSAERLNQHKTFSGSLSKIQISKAGGYFYK